MKKMLKITGIAILVLLVAAIVVLKLFLSNIVEGAVRKGGPMVMGVPVQLEDADIRLLRGKIALSGLVVGNPEGFKTDELFSLGSVKVDIDIRSLMSDTIHIRSIIIDSPEITYERRLKSSNIGALIESLAPEEEEGKEPPEEEKEPKEGGGKKVVIDRISITGGMVKLSAVGMAGLAAPVPLPAIELKDIGKEKDGASPVEVLTSILSAVRKAAVGALGKVGTMAVDGAEAAVGLAAEGVSAAAGLATEGVGAAAGMAGEAAGAAAGMAGDAAGAAAGMAGDAAGAAKDAAAGAAKGLLGGLKKVVPGGDD